MKATRSKRRGVSMVEIAVGAGVALMVLIIAGTTLSLGRRGEKVSLRDACVEAALRTQDRIEADLRRMVLEPGGLPLRVAADGRGLGLWTYEPSLGRRGGMPVNGVAYRLEGEREDTAVVRVADGRVERVGHPHVKGVRFRAAWAGSHVQVRVLLELAADRRRSHASFTVNLPVPRRVAKVALDEVYRFEPQGQFPDAELSPSGSRPRPN